MQPMEAVVVKRTQEEINFDLDGYESISIFASRMTEEGYELILEGDQGEMNELIIEWTEMGVLVQDN